MRGSSPLNTKSEAIDKNQNQVSTAIGVYDSQFAVSSELNKASTTSILDDDNEDEESDEIQELSAKRIKQEKHRSPAPAEKIIESKTICYCSNFDLNINEWFNEFENIEIFKLNMKKNLGIPFSKCLTYYL
jgi:hypothetical protein